MKPNAVIFQTSLSSSNPYRTPLPLNSMITASKHERPSIASPPRTRSVS
jgi:hypothetical protein